MQLHSSTVKDLHDVEQFSILIVVVATQIHTCDKIAYNYTHTLYQCDFPGFELVL